ncbi:hypothetical protein ACFFJT_00495 [Dyella flava]|uniref:Prion-inhibition and propagation HeLo domain-containing protein n=1 Tax=Dyella flava TaxID=1920170 RepID=A0ABS2JYX5_9GAMM|nr:hypothetical protein [Dyella flava]MBM7124202.1 hypothetical protein [Dyella flava]GLQ50520.1 hypothetical protein GCM10010872_19690 [Dyella flava]
MIIAKLPAISCAIDWPGTTAVVKDVVIAAGILLAVYAGLRGFSQWRALEWAKTDLDVGRRLLIATFNTRDCFNSARRWVILESEFPPGYVSDTANVTESRNAHLHMFEKRFKPVRESVVQLQSIRTEAEALWGDEITKLTDALLGCVHELEVGMDMYVRLLGTPAPFGHGQPEAQYEHMVFDLPANAQSGSDGDPNVLKEKAMAAVVRIDNYVREKQKRFVSRKHG